MDLYTRSNLGGIWASVVVRVSSSPKSLQHADLRSRGSNCRSSTEWLYLLSHSCPCLSVSLVKDVCAHGEEWLLQLTTVYLCIYTHPFNAEWPPQPHVWLQSDCIVKGYLVLEKGLSVTLLVSSDLGISGSVFCGTAGLHHSLVLLTFSGL